MFGVEMKFYVFCIEEKEGKKNEKLTQQREKKKKRIVDAKIQLLRKSYKLQRQQERGGGKKQKFVDNLVSKLSELGGFFFL
jgi:riboflavin synthase